MRFESLTDLDEEDEDVRMRLRLNQGTRTIKQVWFYGSLICESSACSPIATDKYPQELADTEPQCTNYIQGSEWENSYEESWYVPKRFYRLTSVTIYKN